MGFGLFVPELKPAFSMSSSVAGYVSSLAFAGFFLGLLAAQWLLNRNGPELPVLSGLSAATLGLAIVAVAPTLTVLSIGVFIAATSAGFAWTPFNDAVHRKVRDADRPAALSEISTGTSVGVLLAGLAALTMVLPGIYWRYCWAFFAVASASALAVNWAALRPVDKAPRENSSMRWRELMQPPAIPLFSVAFVFGITSAVYISFAADRFAQAGLPGLPGGSAGPMVFIAYGICGLTGILTDRIRHLIGLTSLLRALLVASAASLILAALLQGHWTGLIASAGLQGVNVMMTSAVLAFWSERLFPSFPSLGFTVALLATAAGSVIGPAFAGVVSGRLGPEAMFLGAAVLPLAAALLVRRRRVVTRPAQ